jgi:hypothetical protein
MSPQRKEYLSYVGVCERQCLCRVHFVQDLPRHSEYAIVLFSDSPAGFEICCFNCKTFRKVMGRLRRLIGFRLLRPAGRLGF